MNSLIFRGKLRSKDNELFLVSIVIEKDLISSLLMQMLSFSKSPYVQEYQIRRVGSFQWLWRQTIFVCKDSFVFSGYSVPLKMLTLTFIVGPNSFNL